MGHCCGFTNIAEWYVQAESLQGDGSRTRQEIPQTASWKAQGGFCWCHAIDTVVQLCATVGLGIKLTSMSVMTVLEVDITSFASKSWYCSEGAPQKSKSELCPYVCYDRCIRLPVFFSYFFCESFVYSVPFWCHPSRVVVKTRGLNEDFSMSITFWLHLSFYLSCCW